MVTMFTCTTYTLATAFFIPYNFHLIYIFLKLWYAIHGLQKYIGIFHVLGTKYQHQYTSSSMITNMHYVIWSMLIKSIYALCNVQCLKSYLTYVVCAMLRNMFYVMCSMLRNMYYVMCSMLSNMWGQERARWRRRWRERKEEAVKGFLLTLRVRVLLSRHVIWWPGRRPGYQLVLIMCSSMLKALNVMQVF